MCNMTVECVSRPMNCVSLDGASQHCAALGKRLPTLDEWVWIAANGSARTKFPWGNTPAPTNDFVCGVPTGCALGDGRGDVTTAGVRALVGSVQEWVQETDGSAHLMGGYDEQGTAIRVREDPLTSFPPKLLTAGFRCVKVASS
jgi:formylglycine-generating enzyme required for sulfatase activity